MGKIDRSKLKLMEKQNSTNDNNTKKHSFKLNDWVLYKDRELNNYGWAVIGFDEDGKILLSNLEHVAPEFLQLVDNPFLNEPPSTERRK